MFESINQSINQSIDYSLSHFVPLSRLKLQFLASWTNMIKRFGKTIILFLLQVIRAWTPAEVCIIRAQHLLRMKKYKFLHLYLFHLVYFVYPIPTRTYTNMFP